MIDWLNIASIPLWAGQGLNGKRLLIIHDSDVKKLFYYLPFIVTKAQIATQITLCCQKNCFKIIQETFEKDNSVNVVELDYRLKSILNDQSSYDFIVSTSLISYPYGYNPILAYTPQSIYQEKLSNQTINKLICGITFQHNDINDVLSKNNIYQLLYQLNQHCHLYNYDYNDTEHNDYCIGKIFFNPDDIIDLTASYVSMSDIIIAYDNVIASMAVAMGKYAIILADSEYERLLTINNPNVTIINLQNNDIITIIIKQFLKYQQQILNNQSQRQQKIVTQALQSNNDGKRAIVNQCANEFLFKESIEVLKTIPVKQRNDNDWNYLVSCGIFIQDYQLVYDVLTEKLNFDDLTDDQKKQMLISVQKLENYKEFMKYALMQYGGNFPDIEHLEINQVASMLQIAIVTESKDKAIYYCDYLLRHNPLLLNSIIKNKMRLIDYYFSINSFIDAWLIYEQIKNKRHIIFDRIKLPYWQGNDIDNRKLLVFCYETIGETIFFLSLIHQFIRENINITLTGNFKALLTIINRSFPNIITVNDILHNIENINQDYDAKVYLNDMPRLLNINESVMAKNTLKIDSKKRNQYRKKLEQQANGKKIIGVSFYSRNHETGLEKYCDLDLWRPILTIDNVVFVNLQYGVRAYDLDIKAKELNIDFIHWDKPHPSHDFDDFTALVGAVDMIISTPNTLVHQAGAIGILCYVMTGKHHNWHASPNEKSHWYQNQIIIRQKDNENDWQGVIERAKNHILENQFS